MVGRTLSHYRIVNNRDGAAIWASDTNRYPGSRLRVQDDGNVVIYRSGGPAVWASNTVKKVLPTGPTAQGDDLQPGEVLGDSESISSANGQFTLRFVNAGFVLRRNLDGERYGSFTVVAIELCVLCSATGIWFSMTDI